jgi:hypothetical protein
LGREGIERIDFRDARHAKPILIIEEDDLLAFEAAAKDESNPFEENERDTLVEIVALSYNPRRQWRLREGASSFGAYIRDADFWERVHRREISFAERDMLRVRLRVVQTIDAATGRLKAEHTVVRVIELVMPR